MRYLFCLISTTLSFNLYAACSLELTANDNMRFDTRKIEVDSSCDQFTINFKHTGEIAAEWAGHNVVIIESGNYSKVVSSIDPKLGLTSGYLPEMPEVIAKTAIIGGGAETNVTFNATKLSKNQKYTFFCSFPGHFGQMMGNVEIK
tara:strand:- start:1462 stop:1899 length:438 start_codon:yes stop_codon:yes gene_type:complete